MDSERRLNKAGRGDSLNGGIGRRRGLVRVHPYLDQVIVKAGFSSLADWARCANVSVHTLYHLRAHQLRPGESVIRRLLAVARAPIDPIVLADALLAKKEKAS